jgi:HEPN domain-containing protein
MRKESQMLWAQALEDIDYPNAANAVPARIYTKKSAEMHLKCGREVIEWVKKELGLKT